MTLYPNEQYKHLRQTHGLLCTIGSQLQDHEKIKPLLHILQFLNYTNNIRNTEISQILQHKNSIQSRCKHTNMIPRSFILIKKSFLIVYESQNCEQKK